MQEESYLGFRRTIQGKVFHDVDSEECKMEIEKRACNRITEEICLINFGKL